MNWLYEGKPLEAIPTGAIGFVYELVTTEGLLYIGKCDFYTTRTIPAKKDGTKRDGHISFKNRDILIDPATGNIATSKADRKRLRAAKVKATRQVYETIKKEDPNWKSYESSSEDMKDHKVAKKTILEFAPTKKSLTYLEERYLFAHRVLESDKYLNQSIRGIYYKGDLLWK